MTGLYLFKYSERPGTPAAKLDDDVSRERRQLGFSSWNRPKGNFKQRIYER